MLSQYEENLQNEKIEKNRLSENYEDKIQKLTMVSKCRTTEWPADWLTDRWTDWPTDGQLEWLTDWREDRQMTDWPINAYQWDVGYYWSFAVLVNKWKCSFPASSRPQQCIGLTKGKDATVHINKILNSTLAVKVSREAVVVVKWTNS